MRSVLRPGRVYLVRSSGSASGWNSKLRLYFVVVPPGRVTVMSIWSSTPQVDTPSSLPASWSPAASTVISNVLSKKTWSSVSTLPVTGGVTRTVVDTGPASAGGADTADPIGSTSMAATMAAAL